MLTPMSVQSEQSSVDAARAEVDRLNNVHYDLLGQRDAITDEIAANANALADAIEALSEAEAQASRANRPDTSGEMAPPDPPSTQVPLGQAVHSETVGR